MLCSLKSAAYSVYVCVPFRNNVLLGADVLQLAPASIDHHWSTAELQCTAAVHVTVNWHLLPAVPAVVVFQRPASFSHDLSAKPRPAIGTTLLL